MNGMGYCSCYIGMTCDDCRKHYTERDVDYAQGNYLDTIAENYNLRRMWTETDSEFRERIKRDGLNRKKHTRRDHECECGAYKCGYTKPGLGHSDYCPMFKTYL